MNKVLVIIDMQNDFIDGSLGTPEAQAIVDKVCDKIREYKSNQWDIVYTRDTHTENYLNTPEGLNLPVKHCIYQTEGWELNKKIQSALVESGWAYIDWFNKFTFGSQKLVKHFVEEYCDYNQPIDEIELVGLCTDICVISNAIMLKNAFYDKFVTITVDASCCAGVTPEKHKAALEVMKSCQINVINE